MAKILSKSGSSLADTYQVEGSIAGIEELLSENVNLVHEMGATIMSERLAGRLVVMAPNAAAQNVNWDVGIASNLQPIQPTRLLGVAVVVDVTSRISHASVHIATIPPLQSLQDIPIWSWEAGAGSDFERTVRIKMDGTAANLIMLQPSFDTPMIPNLIIGTAQQIPVPAINFRGRTASFGAGTVLPQCILYLAFPERQTPASHGLPLPSW